MTEAELDKLVTELRNQDIVYDQAADAITILRRRLSIIEKLLTTRMTRSAPIEEALLAIAVGKRALPTRDECGAWGAKLGIPVEAQIGS